MNYKTAENRFEIKGDIAYITVFKKDGSELVCQIDAKDAEKVKAMGTWFAEWQKDFNAFTVQNVSATMKNKKNKPLKQSIQAVVLDTNTKAPISHVNGDMLDNRKANLVIVERNQKNEYEIVDEDTIAIILKDKYGAPHAKALISYEDLSHIVTDEYSWVEYKKNGDICVIANTPEGRIHLDRVLMNPGEGQTIHHINLNPLDCRRENLENVGI